MIIEIKNPQNTENQAIDKTSETDDRMINKNVTIFKKYFTII